MHDLEETGANGWPDRICFQGSTESEQLTKRTVGCGLAGHPFAQQRKEYCGVDYVQAGPGFGDLTQTQVSGTTARR